MEIFTKDNPKAHGQFQKWRYNHQDGYIIKLVNVKKGIIHNTICQHLGDFQWAEGENNWGSLGNSTKVGFDNEAELQDWITNEHIEVSQCKSCKPKIQQKSEKFPVLSVYQPAAKPKLLKETIEQESTLSVSELPLSLDKVEVELKTGDEPLTFSGARLNITLLDFWKWNESDLLSNATRGVLAEFIVASALNLNLKKSRVEWAAYDLETPNGIKIEVKSSAYLQTWFQKDYSKISFGTKSSFALISDTNKYEETAKRQADVYVFCLLKHKNKQTVNPLNLDQWEFYVLATKQLDVYSGSQNSIRLSALQGLTKSIAYDQLHSEVKLKFKLHN